MGVRQSVFGSKSEERGFRSIAREWSNSYSLYPNLPFANVFEPADSIGGTWHLFYKTSIDYTLCTKDGRPLMAIDFDGMGHGFNRNGEYVVVRETKDPNRKAKFDFKLGYSQQQRFPYYVISYDEIDPIGQDILLIIVDGIIGQELSRAELRERMQQIPPEELEMIKSLPSDEQSEHLQYLVTDLEVEAEFAHDPIVKKSAQVATELRNRGCEVRKWSFTDYFDPELPGENDLWPLNVETLRARIEAIKRVSEVKCVCTLETSIGEVSDVARMRNVGDIGQTLVIVKNIAELLAYSKALRLVRR